MYERIIIWCKKPVDSSVSHKLKRKPRRGMLVILANAWSLMDLGVKIVFSTWSGSLAHEEIPQPLTGFYWVCNNWRASGCQPEVSPLLLGSSWLIHVFMEKGMVKMFVTFKIFNYYKNWQITCKFVIKNKFWNVRKKEYIFVPEKASYNFYIYVVKEN